MYQLAFHCWHNVNKERRYNIVLLENSFFLTIHQDLTPASSAFPSINNGPPDQISDKSVICANEWEEKTRKGTLSNGECYVKAIDQGNLFVFEMLLYYNDQAQAMSVWQGFADLMPDEVCAEISQHSKDPFEDWVQWLVDMWSKWRDKYPSWIERYALLLPKLLAKVAHECPSAQAVEMPDSATVHLQLYHFAQMLKALPEEKYRFWSPVFSAILNHNMYDNGLSILLRNRQIDDWHGFFTQLPLLSVAITPDQLAKIEWYWEKGKQEAVPADICALIDTLQRCDKALDMLLPDPIPTKHRAKHLCDSNDAFLRGYSVNHLQELACRLVYFHFASNLDELIPAQFTDNYMSLPAYWAKRNEEIQSLPSSNRAQLCAEYREALAILAIHPVTQRFSFGDHLCQHMPILGLDSQQQDKPQPQHAASQKERSMAMQPKQSQGWGFLQRCWQGVCAWIQKCVQWLRGRWVWLSGCLFGKKQLLLQRTTPVGQASAGLQGSQQTPCRGSSSSPRPAGKLKP